MKPVKTFFYIFLAAVLFCLLTWFSAVITAGIMNLAQHTGGAMGIYLTDKGGERIMRRTLLVGIIIILILTLKRFGWQGWKDCGWIQPETEFTSRWVKFLQGIVLGFITLGSIAALTIPAGLHHFRTITETNLQLAGLILLFSFSGLLVALVEETICRGILFRVFSRAWNIWAAALVTSIGFAVAHFAGPTKAAFYGDSFLTVTFNVTASTLASFIPPHHSLIQFINLTLLGMVLCVFVMRTKTIWMSVGAHAAWVLIIKLHSHFTTLNPAAAPSIWLGQRNDFTDSLAATIAFTALILLTLWGNKIGALLVKVFFCRLWSHPPLRVPLLASAKPSAEPGQGGDHKLLSLNSLSSPPAEGWPKAGVGSGATFATDSGLPVKIHGQLWHISSGPAQLKNFLQTGENLFSTGNILKAYPGCSVVSKDGLVFKKYRPKSFINSLRFAFRPPRVKRAFRLAGALIDCGLPTPPVLAWSAARRFGFLVSEAMIVSEVKDAEPLTDWLKRKTDNPAVRLKVMEAYGNLMAGFHRNGYSNRDLKHENVMCSKKKPWLFWVVDLDGVRKQLFVTRRRTGKDLFRVGNSLALLGWTGKTEIAAFFKAYNKEVPARLRRHAFPGQ